MIYHCKKCGYPSFDCNGGLSFPYEQEHVCGEGIRYLSESEYKAKFDRDDYSDQELEGPHCVRCGKIHDKKLGCETVYSKFGFK